MLGFFIAATLVLMMYAMERYPHPSLNSHPDPHLPPRAYRFHFLTQLRSIRHEMTALKSRVTSAEDQVYGLDNSKRT